MNRTLNIAAMLGVVALAPAAQAVVLTDTVSVPTATTEISGVLNLKKFDVSNFASIPAGAILQSITLSATSNATNSGTLTNTAAQAQTFKITFETDVTLTGPNSISLVPAPMSTQTLTNIPVGVAQTVGPLTGTDTKSVNVPGADFSFYTGAGLFALNYGSLSGQTVLGGGGNQTSSIVTTADIAATVTYEYRVVPTDVPEPGSVALVFGMLGGAAFTLRRRARK